MQKEIHAGAISVYEMAGAFACITVFMLLLEPERAALLSVSKHDWFYLFLLSVIYTTMPFIIGVYILMFNCSIVLSCSYISL